MKTRSALSLTAILVILMSFFTVPVLAKDDEGDGGNSGPDATERPDDGDEDGKSERDDEKERDEDDDEKERDDRNKGRGPPKNESDAPRSAGRLTVTNGSVDGRYVDLQFDSEACILSDLRVYNVTVIDSIQLPQPCKGAKKGGSQGSSMELGSRLASVKVHDAPNGLLDIRAEDGASVTIDFADALAWNDTVQKGREFSIENLTGILRVQQEDDEEDDDEDGNESQEDDAAANATFDPNNVVVDDKARVWVHPMGGGTEERREIRDAIKKGKVAGEIDVLVADGSLSPEVLAYDDVLIKAERRNESSFRFLVDANFTEGRTFVINIGSGVFKHDRIGVQYWDIDNTSLATMVNITEADSLEDVLEILDGEGPEYWITKDKAGHHVLVAVPHFSAHAFEVMSLGSLPAEVVPVVVYGLVAALATVALGVAGLFQRRRRA